MEKVTLRMRVKEKRTYGSCGENTEEVFKCREKWVDGIEEAEEKSSEAGDGVYMKASTGWAQAPLQFYLQP